jgi:hypothetical protein
VNPDVAKTLTVVALRQNSLGPENFALNNNFKREVKMNIS